MSFKTFVEGHSENLGLLFLRLMTGAGIASHGYGKLFGGRIESFAAGVGHMGFPYPIAFAWAAALSEFVGGILVALGLKARAAAFFIFVTMSVAIFMHHAHDPFKVKELALAYWTMSGSIVLLGAGKFSVDRS